VIVPVPVQVQVQVQVQLPLSRGDSDGANNTVDMSGFVLYFLGGTSKGYYSTTGIERE
jgi:hypothetical protein